MSRGDQYERTYELGGRYKRRYGKFNPYARGMYGRGVFNFPFDQANLAYNLISGGVGVDYNLMRHVNVRADYEVQKWFSFPPNATTSGPQLTPQILTIGAAYRF